MNCELSQSLRLPSSRNTISEPRPMAIVPMPHQSPRRNKASRIFSDSSPHTTAMISSAPGRRFR